MVRIQDFLQKLGINKPKLPAPNVEELRTDFKARYHNFKLLLNANNKALEIMAGMEQALQGKRSFGMSFIRTGCTSISVNVFRMINNLTELAPGKYDDLRDRFNEIQQKIEHLLVEKTPVQDQRLVISLDSIHKDMADLVGNKMANLGEIKNHVRLKVPSGFTITAYAYKRFIEEYPDHQYAPYAQYQIAMVYFSKIEDAARGYGYAEQALEEFKKLKNNSRNLNYNLLKKIPPPL